MQANRGSSRRTARPSAAATRRCTPRRWPGRPTRRRGPGGGTVDVANSTARPGGHGVDGAERAFLHAGADDRRGQPDQLVDVGGDDGLGIGRQRPIGGEQLRILGGPAAFDGDQGVEQLP